MDNALFKNKQLLGLTIVAFLLVMFVIALTVLLSRNPDQISDQEQTLLVTPTPYASLTDALSSGRFSPIQKTEITETTSEEVERFPDIIGKEELQNNMMLYSLESSFPTRENQIITQDETVIFERILTPVKSSAPGYARISDYTTLLGDPEEFIRGSHHYGPFIYTYIYASEGLAIIGNPVTDEAFEIHQFTPMSVEDYIQEFGDDIDEDAPEGIR